MIMFELPLYLEPAVLLEYTTLPRSAELRRIGLLAACRRGDWNEGLRLLRARSSSDWLSWAVTLVHLGDEALRAQCSEIAGRAYRMAQQQFHQHVAPVQRQNEAASGYGLALVAWGTQDTATALDLLEQAMQLCITAQTHWIAVQSDYARGRQCRDINAWFRAIADQIAQSELAEMDIFGSLYAQPLPLEVPRRAAPLPRIRLPGKAPIWERPRSWDIITGHPGIIGQ